MKSWFHSNTNGPRAEERLLKLGANGSFLVRPSSNSPGNFTLSVRKEFKVLHLPILNSSDGYIIKEEHFSSLQELVQYYFSDKKKFLDSNSGKVNLISPLYSIDPVFERWYHGWIDRQRAENLLKMEAVEKTFLVRQSTSRPGSYVLSVLLNQMNIQHIELKYMNKKYFIPGEGTAPLFDNISDLVLFYQSIPIPSVSSQTFLLGEPLVTTQMLAKSIGLRITELKKVSNSDDLNGFSEEFEKLEVRQMSYNFSTNIGQQFRIKNRYKNILPYDHTRVELIDGSLDFPEYRYINANYIDLDKEGILYIATQGPLENTVDDLWRMVIQENVQIIICLTLMNENGKNKCFQYWNDVGLILPVEMMNNMQADIRCLSEENNNGFIVRTFELSINDINPYQRRVFKETRQLKQFHFLSWPDKCSLQEMDLLLDLIEQVECVYKSTPKIESNENKREPIIVHCSAGIGRTGTFIALSHLHNQIKKLGLSVEIDIFSLVAEMRTFRSGMVQTVEQYEYIYLFVESFVKKIGQHKELQSTSLNHAYGNLLSDVKNSDIYHLK